MTGVTGRVANRTECLHLHEPRSANHSALLSTNKTLYLKFSLIPVTGSKYYYIYYILIYLSGFAYEPVVFFFFIRYVCQPIWGIFKET